MTGHTHRRVPLALLAGLGRGLGHRRGHVESHGVSLMFLPDETRVFHDKTQGSWKLCGGCSGLQKGCREMVRPAESSGGGGHGSIRQDRHQARSGSHTLAVGVGWFSKTLSGWLKLSQLATDLTPAMTAHGL